MKTYQYNDDHYEEYLGAQIYLSSKLSNDEYKELYAIAIHGFDYSEEDDSDLIFINLLSADKEAILSKLEQFGFIAK